jgi:hypothetical protein
VASGLPSDTTPAPPRPSVGAALKTAATSPAGPWAGVAGAIVLAVLAHWQSSQANTDTARASYEALRAASEANTAAIAAIQKSQVETQKWVEELAAAAARRQATTEKAIKGKVNKPSTPPIAAPPVEPTPPAPPPPPPPAPVRLLPFDALAKADP